MKRIIKINALVGVLVFAASFQANAVAILGNLTMGGAFNPVVFNVGTGTWDITASLPSATGVDFEPNAFGVTSASVDFSPLLGTMGTIKDFQFDPVLADLNGNVGPIAGFWQAGAFSFTLSTVSEGFTNDPNNFLILEGTGVVSAAGFQDTLGTWTFTGDTTGTFGGSGQGIFSWSGSSSALNVVPEPGILALLGIGLLGLAGRSMVGRESRR